MSNRTELRARGGAGAVKDGAVRSMPTRAAVIAVDGGQPVRRQASQSVGDGASRSKSRSREPSTMLRRRVEFTPLHAGGEEIALKADVGGAITAGTSSC